MFTIEQLKLAHSKVRSGADFPAYIRDIKQLGVTFYETFVTDGHTDYSGANGYRISSPARYAPLTIAGQGDAARFRAELEAHQQGKTDFPAFCAICAATGIEKWAVCLEEMTCSYYDKEGEEVLVEDIPA